MTAIVQTPVQVTPTTVFTFFFTEGITCRIVFLVIILALVKFTFIVSMFLARTCFNEFLLLLNVVWVNKGLYCIGCN